MNSYSPLRLRAQIYDQNSLTHLNQQEIQTNPVKFKGYTEYFSWGNDRYGQLGHGTNSSSKQPRRLDLPKSLSFDVVISVIACGSNHSVFLTATDLLFSFGDNNLGQLGINDRKVKFSEAPLLVASLKSIKIDQITCGGQHSGVLTK